MIADVKSLCLLFILFTLAWPYERNPREHCALGCAVLLAIAKAMRHINLFIVEGNALVALLWGLNLGGLGGLGWEEGCLEGEIWRKGDAHISVLRIYLN